MIWATIGSDEVTIHAQYHHSLSSHRNIKNLAFSTISLLTWNPTCHSLSFCMEDSNHPPFSFWMVHYEHTHKKKRFHQLDIRLVKMAWPCCTYLLGLDSLGEWYAVHQYLQVVRDPATTLWSLWLLYCAWMISISPRKRSFLSLFLIPIAPTAPWRFVFACCYGYTLLHSECSSGGWHLHSIGHAAGLSFVPLFVMCSVRLWSFVLSSWYFWFDDFLSLSTGWEIKGKPLLDFLLAFITLHCNSEVRLPQTTVAVIV